MLTNESKAIDLVKTLRKHITTYPEYDIMGVGDDDHWLIQTSFSFSRLLNHGVKRLARIINNLPASTITTLPVSREFESYIVAYQGVAARVIFGPVVSIDLHVAPRVLRSFHRAG
jgi:hypothetical protein